MMILHLQQTMKKKFNIYAWLMAGCLAVTVTSCKLPEVAQRAENKNMPAAYYNSTSTDTLSSGKMKWRDYFTDPYLISLIDTALVNNQELNVTLQEIQVAQSEIRARRGEYLPFLGLRAGAGAEKVSRYTREGALERAIDIIPGKENPEPLGDFVVGANINWEADIWKKLRNAKKSAVNRYLSSVEGKNFVITNLVAEIAENYYELLALDNELSIVRQNIEIQTNALNIVKLQKESARVTELAVKRFEAQVLDTRGLEFNIQQEITETENRINFLVGRFPQPVQRSSEKFRDIMPNVVSAGIPSQLLENRPDVKQAEYELAASKLDVKIAKARFYPSLGISAGVGYQAFNAEYIFRPQSLLYSIAGELTAPLINRNAIKAAYIGANAKQIQAVYNYERTILNAYIEVVNQMAKISNMQKAFDLKLQQVDALNQSVKISNDLFISTRADYMEVLLTQRDALETKFELIDVKKQQLSAMVNIYHALGGGWN